MRNDLMNLMRPQTQKRGSNPYATIQRFAAFNQNANYAVPPFGLVEVQNTAGDGSLVVDLPSADGVAVWVNGPAWIPQKQYGMVSRAWPIWAAYDSGSGTPAIGDGWGAAANSYYLTKDKQRYRIEATPVSTGSPPRVLISDAKAALSHQAATLGSSASLTTAYANIGLFVNLPIQSTWMVLAQVNGTLNAAASPGGAGDYLTFRFFDGANQWGVEAVCCDAACGGLTVVGCVTLIAMVTPTTQPLQIDVQGAVVTSSGSAGGSQSSSIVALPWS